MISSTKYTNKFSINFYQKNRKALSEKSNSDKSLDRQMNLIKDKQSTSEVRQREQSPELYNFTN